tara:strand:+ start:384 stop:788 length:405 start_codon:yes stop_codon:yes gene_type:complete
MKILLASLLTVTPVSASINDNVFQEGYSESRQCFITEYREEYIPGTVDAPGYVQSFHETSQVPCRYDADSLRNGGYTRKTTIQFDNNDCTDGKIAGGLVGGGLGAAISRGDGRWWAIPLGAVLGSRIGCEVDGG